MKKIVVFISANTAGAGGTNCRALKPSTAITRNLGVRTNNFELLMLIQDRAYSVCEFRRNYLCDDEINVIQYYQEWHYDIIPQYICS